MYIYIYICICICIYIYIYVYMYLDIVIVVVVLVVAALRARGPSTKAGPTARDTATLQRFFANPSCRAPQWATLDATPLQLPPTN